MKSVNFLVSGPFDGGVHDSTTASQISLDLLVEENCKIDGTSNNFKNIYF